MKGKGFYVVPQSQSSYDNTKFTVSSTLNMQFLDLVVADARAADPHGKDVSDNAFNRGIQDSTVLQLLRRLGYKYINFCSGFSAFDFLHTADVNIRLPIRGYFGGLFNSFVLMLTPWSTLEQYFPLLRDFYIDLRLLPSEKLPEVVAIPGPKFVTMHTDIAHAPLLLDENGHRGRLPVAIYNAVDTPQRYFSQIKWANKQIENWINIILSGPGPKPIIVMQSDHGPDFPMDNEHLFVNERLKNFSAIYLPGMHDKGLYGRISTVNVFRVIFNDYYDAHLPILPDKAFLNTGGIDSADFKDVTKDLDFTTNLSPNNYPKSRKRRLRSSNQVETRLMKSSAHQLEATSAKRLCHL